MGSKSKNRISSFIFYIYHLTNMTYLFESVSPLVVDMEGLTSSFLFLSGFFSL